MKMDGKIILHLATIRLLLICHALHSNVNRFRSIITFAIIANKTIIVLKAPLQPTIIRLAYCRDFATVRLNNLR